MTEPELIGKPKLFVFPGGIDPDVLAIGGRPVPYARTERFAATVLESQRWLLDMLGCADGQLVSFTASGTAAMESVVSNLVGSADNVLVIEGGTFGKRWVHMLSMYPHKRIDVEHVPFGKDLDYGRIEELLSIGEYRVLFMQHHETSSGVRFDVERLGAACKATGTLFVVDAISSFLADEFSMGRFGIDAAVISSHKGLCLPPGLSFVALGPRVLREPYERRGVYLDFAENLESLRRGHPLFTPAVQLHLQLHQRLQNIRESGIAEVIGAVRRKAVSFRRMLEADNRVMVTTAPSNCLSSFYVDCAALDLVLRLAADGFFIMPSMEPQQVRVAHLGTSSVEDHQELYARIVQHERQISGKRK